MSNTTSSNVDKELTRNIAGNKLKKEFILASLSFIFALFSNMLLVHITNFPISWLGGLIFTLGLTLIFTLLFYNWKTSAGFLGVLLILSLALLIPSFRGFVGNSLQAFDGVFKDSANLLGKFFAEGFTFFNGNFTDADAKAYTFLGFSTLFINTILSTLLIQKISTHWYPWIYTVLILTLGIHLNIGGLFIYIVPLLAVSVIMTLRSSAYLNNLFKTASAKSTNKHLEKVGIHLIFIVIISITLSAIFGKSADYNKIYSPFWQGIVDDVMTIFPKSFQNELSVNSYSIGQDGFYPLTERLGGSVELKDQKIAEITGTAPQLLKVQSSDFYNGLSWFRTVNNPNYRYDSPFNRGSEIDVFNEPANKDFFKHLNGTGENEVFKNYSYELKPLRQGTQILFLSGTPTHLESSRDEALLFYFNQAGMIYAKESFNNEHFYGVSTYNIDANSLGFNAYEPNMSRLSELDSAAKQFAAENKTLSNQENAYQNYLQVPDSPLYQAGGTIYELAKSIAAESTGPYTTAQALLTYFVNNPEFSYSLDVETPPDNVDFLEYFLNTKVGYCTYYATAMTMMARLNGIPARYVEGYTLRDLNKSNGGNAGASSFLNSKYAHAWTEVYLNGLGWVALDPTPGYSDNSDQDVIEPTPTPSPTPEPTTTPSTEATTENNESTTTPSSSSSNTTSTTTDSEQNQENSRVDLKALWSILLIILGIALLLLLAYLYYRYRLRFINNIHNLDIMKTKFNDRKAHANYYWDELLNLHGILSKFSLDETMTELDLAQLLENTETEYLNSKQDNSVGNKFKSRVNWQELANIIVENKYSRNGISDEKLQVLAHEFDVLEAFVQEELGNLNYTFKRILPPEQGKINR